jgi:dTDP-glucose pyrophosphorylase
MWGIIPAAGSGSRIQPLAFSKELLPVGGRLDGSTERPRAVSEYIIDRMIRGGASKICFVISPGKSDILGYYGGGIGPAEFAYVVQPRPAGLCDAIFRALPVIAPQEHVVIGLPDTIWFPEDGLCALPNGVLSFLLFPVEHPEFFDAVMADEDGWVREIQAEGRAPKTNLISGAFKMPGAVLRELFYLWNEPDRGDEHMGTLVNAYLQRGGRARAVPVGESYVDIGTLHGYRAAINLLSTPGREGARPTSAKPMLQTSEFERAYVQNSGILGRQSGRPPAGMPRSMG